MPASGDHEQPPEGVELLLAVDGFGGVVLVDGPGGGVVGVCPALGALARCSSIMLSGYIVHHSPCVAISLPPLAWKASRLGDTAVIRGPATSSTSLTSCSKSKVL